MRIYFFILSLVLCCSIAHASDEHHQNKEELEALLNESVVTTASRHAEKASSAPASIINITAEDIASSGARTVDDALELLGAGVWVSRVRDYTSGGDIGAQGVFLRDAGKHVLVMLDGMILNSQGTGRILTNEALGIPLSIIDHIELMLGPGSVMYGSNAMFAVINIFTKSYEHIPRLQTTLELGTALPYNAQGTLQSNDDTRWGFRSRIAASTSHVFQLGHESIKTLLALDYIQERSASMGVDKINQLVDDGDHSFWLPPHPHAYQWGGAARSQMHVPSLLAKATWRDLQLQISYRNYWKNMPFVGLFNDPTAKEIHDDFYAELKYQQHVLSYFDLSSRIYLGRSAFQERSTYGELIYCPAELNQGCRFSLGAQTTWIGAEQRIEKSWGSEQQFNSMFGYDVRGRFFKSHPATYRDYTTHALAQTLREPSIERKSVIGALFAQQTWQPLDAIHVNVGARFDADSLAKPYLSPRASVLFKLPTQTNFRLSYTQAFRAPSHYELTEQDPTFRIPPKKLKSEKVQSAEVELQQHYKILTASLRGFWAYYQNMIESRDATQAEIDRFPHLLLPGTEAGFIQINDNLSRMKVLGLGSVISLKLPAFLRFQLSFNTSHNQLGSQIIQRGLPQFYGNAQLHWQHPVLKQALSFTCAYGSIGHVYFGSQIAAQQTSEPIQVHSPAYFTTRLGGNGVLYEPLDLHWRAAVNATWSTHSNAAIAIGTHNGSNRILAPLENRFFTFFALEKNF